MLPKMINRHGLIAGATGTGKTVSIKVMAEAQKQQQVAAQPAAAQPAAAQQAQPGGAPQTPGAKNASPVKKAVSNTMKQTLSGTMRKVGHEAERALIRGLFGNAKKW